MIKCERAYGKRLSGKGNYPHAIVYSCRDELTGYSFDRFKTARTFAIDGKVLRQHG